MFIGREKELALLTNQYNKTGTAILLYGKRRVGKTTLIKESFKYFDGLKIYFECVKSSLKENLNIIQENMRTQGIITSYTIFNTFIDLFKYFKDLNKKVLIVIDEYSYLKSMENSEYVDSLFQNIIDNYLDNICLVLSGSHIAIMKSLMLESNPLYGRFSLYLDIKEFNYLEASKFYPNIGVLNKIAYYSIFGGSPFVNSLIDFNLSVEENIINHILNINSPINAYIHMILNTDLKNQNNALNILSVIANGKKKYFEIEQKIGMKTNGSLNKQLNTLMEIEIIKKIAPINKKSDNKKMHYAINDNLIKFYFTYVYKKTSILEMLGSEMFYKLHIEDAIKHFIANRFEAIVKQFFSIKVKKGELQDVYDIGTLYYDDSVNKTNGEFDCVLEHKEGYSIFEVKYYKEPLDSKVIEKEIEQVKNIPNIHIKKIGFVSASGFKENNDDIIQITGEDLYFQ